MSYGLPIVTTHIRGAVDHLTEGENVLFVPPHQPDDLARALRRLLNDPGMCADMGERNREKVKSLRSKRRRAALLGYHGEVSLEVTSYIMTALSELVLTTCVSLVDNPHPAHV